MSARLELNLSESVDLREGGAYAQRDGRQGRTPDNGVDVYAPERNQQFLATACAEDRGNVAALADDVEAIEPRVVRA
jgi:hypothetical protein